MLKQIKNFNINIFSNRMVVINIDQFNNYSYYGTDHVIYDNCLLEKYLILNKIYYKFYNIVLVYNNNRYKYETRHEYYNLTYKLDKKWNLINNYMDDDLKSIDSDDSVIIDNKYSFNMIIVIENNITKEKYYFGSDFIIYNSDTAYKYIKHYDFDSGFKCMFYIKQTDGSYYSAYVIKTYNKNYIS